MKDRKNTYLKPILRELCQPTPVVKVYDYIIDNNNKWHSTAGLTVDEYTELLNRIENSRARRSLIDRLFAYAGEWWPFNLICFCGMVICMSISTTF